MAAVSAARRPRRRPRRLSGRAPGRRRAVARAPNRALGRAAAAARLRQRSRHRARRAPIVASRAAPDDPWCRSPVFWRCLGDLGGLVAASLGSLCFLFPERWFTQAICQSRPGSCGGNCGVYLLCRAIVGSWAPSRGLFRGAVASRRTFSPGGGRVSIAGSRLLTGQGCSRRRAGWARRQSSAATRRLLAGSWRGEPARG